MFRFLKNLFLLIGIHTAPKGTLLNALMGLCRTASFWGIRILRGGAVPPYVKDGMAFSKKARPFVVAMRVSGGLGDHLVAARYLRDLFAYAGEFPFDVFSDKPGMARWVFSGFKTFDACYRDNFLWKSYSAYYPLALWVTQFVLIYDETAKWAEVQRHAPKLIDVCHNLEKRKEPIAAFIEEHPHLDNFYAERVVFMEKKRETVLQAMSGIPCQGPLLALETSADALGKFGLAGKVYLTVHNGFDAEFSADGMPLKKSTKAYPHFGQVLALLRQQIPQLYVVQVGVQTSTPIDGVDLNLMNKTSLTELAALIKNSALHLDNEGGLVHLASCFGVKSCVLFGPTSMEYYAYEGNINMRPLVCGNCWWMTRDWMKLCPKGYEGPRCLTEQPPENVVKALFSEIEKLKTAERTA